VWQFRPITTSAIGNSAPTLLRGQHVEAEGHSGLSSPFLCHSIDVIYGKEHHKEANKEIMNSTVTVQFMANHLVFLNLCSSSILYMIKLK